MRRLARERPYVIGGAAVAVLLAIGLVAYAMSSSSPARQPVAASPSRTASTPTATVLGMWRVQGTVTDEQNRPLEGVCIGVGPATCTPTNPRTDAQGKWFIDLPVVTVEYEFHFTKDGYQPGYTKILLNGPQNLGVVLTR